MTHSHTLTVKLLMQLVRTDICVCEALQLDFLSDLLMVASRDGELDMFLRGGWATGNHHSSSLATFSPSYASSPMLLISQAEDVFETDVCCLLSKTFSASCWAQQALIKINFSIFSESSNELEGEKLSIHQDSARQKERSTVILHHVWACALFLVSLLSFTFCSKFHFIISLKF